MSARQRRTLQARVDQGHPILESLINNFSRSLRRFDPSQQFGGPSVYFHLKTIKALSRHLTMVDALGGHIRASGSVSGGQDLGGIARLRVARKTEAWTHRRLGMRRVATSMSRTASAGRARSTVCPSRAGSRTSS